MAAAERKEPEISPIEGRVHVLFDDAEIASSTKALRLNRADADPVVVVPLDDVHPGILEASDTHRSEGELGEAHYYTIKTLTANGVDEAWYFPYAEGDYAPIRDMLTFGGDRVVLRVSDV